MINIDFFLKKLDQPNASLPPVTKRRIDVYSSQEAPSSAPAIVGLWKKSQWGSSRERLIIDRAHRMAVGDPTSTLVIDDDRVVGIASGSYFPNPWTRYTPLKTPIRVDKAIPLYFGYSTYDSIITANTAGRAGIGTFYKNHSTAPVAGNWYDLWPVSGFPVAGTYTGSANTARSLTDADTGAMYKFGNQASTYTMHTHWLSAQASGGTPGLKLYDRVLTYEACITTTTSAVTNTNTATAARYNGTGLSGMQIIWTAQTAGGATANQISTLTYTNQDGTGSKTMPTTVTVNQIVSAAAPTANLGARITAPATTATTTPWGYSLPLAVGDGGARAVANYTLSAVTSGTICIVLGRILVSIPLPTTNVASMIDLVQQLSGLQQVYDGACLSFLAFFPAATAAAFAGELGLGWN